MKLPTIFCVFACCAVGCSSKDLQAKLLEEQKLLKDSANNTTDQVGVYLQKGLTDSAEAVKLQLGAIHARLTGIQFSLDSLAKMRQ